MKKNNNTSLSTHRPKALFILVIIATAMCIFFILFVITNSHWTPIYIPNLPWQSKPVLAAFETPFVVVIAISVLLGSVGTAAVWRTIYARKLQQQLVLKNYIGKLEGELEKTQRLITSTKLDQKHNQGE